MLNTAKGKTEYYVNDLNESSSISFDDDWEFWIALNSC